MLSNTVKRIAPVLESLLWTIPALCLLFVVTFARAQECRQPDADEKEACIKQAELNAARDRLQKKRAAKQKREMQGISFDFTDPEANGLKVMLSHSGTADDITILHGPIHSWIWVVYFPDGTHQDLHGQSVSIVAKEPGTYSVKLMIADASMRYQQSFSHQFRINPVIEWDKF
jgi:hypothetical protein